jgi:signal transduction histidine kinase
MNDSPRQTQKASRRQWSLTTRLMLWQLVALAAAFLVLTGLVMMDKLRAEFGYLDQRMMLFASLFAETAAGASGVSLSSKMQAAEKITEAAFAELEYDVGYQINYQVISADQRIAYASKVAPNTILVSQTGFADIRIRDEEYRAVRVMSSDQQVAVVMAESVATRRALIWPVLLSMIVRLLIFLPLSLLTLWWVIQRSMRGLRALASAMRDRSPGDLSRFTQQSPDLEVQAMVDSLNLLMQRESDRQDIERRFIADAAHQLRTPLAALHAQAHLLIDAKDPNERREAGRALQAGIDRTAHLLSQLIMINRAESTDAFADVTLIDIAELLSERMALQVPLARGKGIRMEFVNEMELDLQANAGAERNTVNANRAGIATIIDNVLENALKFTPNLGQVHVQLTAERPAGKPRQLRISIADSGPGIAEIYQEQVFKRFFRTPNTEASGSGLGLAIALQIARAQGAQIALARGLPRADQSGYGLAVLICLPASVSNAS